MRRRVVVVAALGILSVFALAVWAWPSGQSAEAEEVEVRENGILVTTLTEDQAVKFVSEKTGFEVKRPRNLPPAASRFVFAEAVLPPAEVGSGLKMVRLLFADDLTRAYREGGVWIELHVLPVELSDPPGEALHVNAGRLALFREAVAGGFIYAAVGGGRTYIAMISGADVTEAEVVEMFASIR